MRHTALSTLVVLALLATACGTGPGEDDGNKDFPPPDTVGTKYLEGKLALSALHWPEAADREGRFTLVNESGADLRYLDARVVFFYEAPKEDVARIASESFSQTFNIYKGEQVSLAFTPRTDREIRSIKVSVEEMKQVATVARSKDALGKVIPGSTWLDGRLECVWIEENLTSTPPAITFTVRNNTATEIGGVRYKIVLLRRGAIAYESARWLPIPGGFSPSEEKVIEPDLGETTPGFGIAILLIKEQI